MFRKTKAFGTSALAVAVLAIAGAGTPVALAKTCPRGYTQATINHAQRCLHAGEYCNHNYERQYRHYHYTCVVVRGVYRLEHS
jgi:hypothetical protein